MIKFEIAAQYRKYKLGRLMITRSYRAIELLSSRRGNLFNYAFSLR